MSILHILVRSRQHTVGFSTDILKAFLHVYLDDEDRGFTHFLWLSNPCDISSPFVSFRFRVVFFGVTCSPFMLQAILLYHLTSNDSSISLDLLRNLYVDNIVVGCQTEAAALNFTQSRSVLNSANFNLQS